MPTNRISPQKLSRLVDGYACELTRHILRLQSADALSWPQPSGRRPADCR